MKVTGKGGHVEVGGERFAVKSWEVDTDTGAASVELPGGVPVHDGIERIESNTGSAYVFHHHPPPLDLSADPAARSLVRQWGRQPWQRLHPLRLADRLEETGHDDHAAWLRRFRPGWFAAARRWCHDYSRRAVRRFILRWRESLGSMFPGCEPGRNTLCDGDPTDTPETGA